MGTGDEKEALAQVASFIRAPKDFPFSGASPVSHWESCCVLVAPPSSPRPGLLVELIVKGMKRGTYNTALGQSVE